MGDRPSGQPSHMVTSVNLNKDYIEGPSNTLWSKQTSGFLGSDYLQLLHEVR